MNKLLLIFKTKLLNLKKLLLKYRSYILLIFISAFIIFIGYKYYNYYFYEFKDPNKIKNMIMSYGKYSVLAFLVLQILQVVAFFIPGEIIQVAGGYIFGTLIGSIISIAGITIGSIIDYCISRYFGRPLVKKIISEKDINFFESTVKFGNINYIVFLLYLIPGLPKDAMAYICGISDISFKDFIIYSTLGRLPCILISAYFGAKINTGNYILLILIGITVTLLFLLGILNGDKIIKKILHKS